MTLQTTTSLASRDGAGKAALTGEVVYMYAFDLAYDMQRKPIATLLGQPIEQFAVDPSKRVPREATFYRPRMIRLPAIERAGPAGPVSVHRTVKLLDVGAVSITFRIPFAVDRLEQLVPFHDFRFNDGGSLYQHARELAEQVRRELAPILVRPAANLPEEEAYTVFCIRCPARDSDGRRLHAEDWLAVHRRRVASVLNEEADATHLSEQEAAESTSKSYSYFEDDLVVIDWDAALMVDDPRNFDEVLYIMELANVQLAELEAYDRLLDDAVDRAYRDLSGRRFGPQIRPGIQRQLREIRIDLARLSDELSNITKFFGDWHLARIYQGLSDRFHLADWHRIIDEKLKTLDDLYQIMRSDLLNRWMLTLEVAVVVMFVIEIFQSLLHWTL